MRAPRPSTASLQGVLDAFRSSTGAPGISAAVIRGEAETWIGASGVADPDGGQPMTPTTQFALGSMTKSFVAELVLRLVERGHLALAEPIARYLLPDVESNGATVEEVLGHRSGIPEHVTPRFVAALLAHPSRPWTPGKALSYQQDAPRPRGEYAYSSTNYILLGMAIERITRRSVGTAVRDVLLEPLGLDRITYQGTEKPQGPLAVGLTHLAGAAPVALRDASGLLPCRSVATAAGAAGGMAGDAESMARWADLLYGGSVLPAESLRALMGIDGQGFGSSTFKLDGEEAVGHPGRIPGYRGAFAYLPSLETSCAVLINTDAPDADPLELFRHLVEGLRMTT